MTGGKLYISRATKFDTYKGELSWHNLSLSERTTIARYQLDELLEELDIHEFVMGANLRRIQFDGLRTVIVRTALALEDKLRVRFGSDNETKYSLILPYLEGTALGQELTSLVKGTASEHTNYRMGELEFLAQSGSRPSPMDGLLDLPQDLRLRGILEMLKPKGAFDPRQPKTGDQATDVATADFEQLTFSETMRLIEARQIDMHASYTGSLQAVSQGVARVSTAATLAGIGFWATPMAGLFAAFIIAWWWLPIGMILGIAAFRYSRKAAVNAVLRLAHNNEPFFEVMRKNKIIWLERMPRLR